MKPSLKLAKESVRKTSKKIIIFFLFFVTLFSFLITPVHEAQAQMVVTDLGAIAAAVTGNAQAVAADVKKTLHQTLGTLLLKAGATSFQQVVRSALNKIAYDTANYIGSGGKGQKPLFITKNWGDYLTQVGDEALGSFIENFAANLSSDINAADKAGALATACQNNYQTCAVSCNQNTCSAADLMKQYNACQTKTSACVSACKTAASTCEYNAASSTKAIAASNAAKSGVSSDYANNPSFNICQPSSLEAKVKISLGLVQQQRPGAPNCTATKMVQNWGDAAKKLTDFKDPNFLSTFKDIFNPTSNDLGIYLSARTDMTGSIVKVDENTKLNLSANKGWQDKVNIAKNFIGVPGDAASKANLAQEGIMAQIGKTTGDIVVDASSVFLNQLAISAFNNLMSNLGKTVTGNTPNVNSSQDDPNIQYGEGNLKEVTSSIIKPDFGVRADYDILASLAVCADPEHPAPTDCVIDNKFMQAISEKKTVVEAVQDGYINGNWLLTKDNIQNAYTLRNISILRKYRILPVGWEEAVNKAYADPTNPLKVTVWDMISCFDLNGDYKNFSSGFDQKNQTWCRGLVDPNWVLKAPLNYCKKEGVGAQVINTMITPSILSTNGSQYSPSILNVTRAENYCADSQTCIKEKANGSCEAYGYCNEEKRTWNFSSDSCNPIYNTCSSYTNPTSGKSVSYLGNTLDYSGCDTNSAGCRQYSVFGSYATSTGTVSWDANKSTYFKNIASCNSKDEGCTELLRVKAPWSYAWGENLVMNSDFTNDIIGASSTNSMALNDWAYSASASSYYKNASIVDSTPDGANIGKAIRLQASASGSASIGIYSDLTHPLLPSNFELIPGYSYTVSADVYLNEGTAATIYLGNSNEGFSNSTSTTNSWQHITITRNAAGTYTEPSFGINALGTVSAVVYIKNIKFEVSNSENSYDIYGAYKFYEKLIPPYLEKVCYNGTNGTDYTLKTDAPAVCNNFARKCNKAEVGCEAFTNVKNGLSVSAQVNNSDRCSQECVGYDVYISKADYFNSPQAENIIPTTAKACSAEAVGCSEFTNLDTLAQGGENKEYYTSLKQCIKPSQNSCASFYSWEGTDNGYQLRLYSLQKNPNNAISEPKVTIDDSSACNATIYNKTLGDSQYNPDCREFYNATGQVFYHLISRTVTCSDNCHAYRLSSSDTTCLNGGVWNAQQKACVYMAIPGEGQTCSAAQNGCREYNGNDGNNVKTVSTYNFETDSQGWYSNCQGGLQLKAISNNKDGHSILYKDTANKCLNIGQKADGSVARTPIIKQVIASDNVAAQLNVGGLVEQGKSYSLRFIAKAASDTNVKVYFYNNESSPADQRKAEFATSTLLVSGSGEWNIYQTNLDNLDHAITANEILAISANKDFYFDDVVLTEITDRYYLIKGTSDIPVVCSYDIFSKYQGADYNLGCAQYLDRNKVVNYLHKFSKLCSASSVGCEQMIATQNYSPYSAGIWGDANKNNVCDANEPDCVKVDGDKAIYAVYDSSKQCNVADLGCSRIGQGTPGGSDWSDVYKKNNPNAYDTILCSQTEVGCEEWKAGDGTLNYFRDPGNETCQYRDSTNPLNVGKAWYKVPVKRCDLNTTPGIDGTEKTGKICSSDSECGSGTCVIDTNDYGCSTTYLKTFGLGGSGNQIPTPDKQAGLCDTASSGCTEYIDPVSKFAPDLINNSSFEKNPDGTIEGWINNAQDVSIEQNKLYVFTVTGGNTETKLLFPGNAKELLNDNTLSVNFTATTTAATKNQNIIFASLGNTKVTITGGQVGKVMSLKEAAINYQLQDNVDKKTCNGIVDTDNGCILFNKRSINGANGLATLTSGWSAASSVEKTTPKICSPFNPGSCSANKLIKVTPDRTCSKWLDCVTYVQDPVTKQRTCYAVGECSRLDDKGECSNFENVSTSTVAFNSDGSNKNSSGYYLLNKYELASMQEVGLNTDAHFDFEDNVPTLSCRRAESSGGGACVFNKNIVTDLLIREPEKSPTGLAPNGYPAHGATFLKVPASYIVSPQSAKSWVTVIAKKEYFLNLLVNTKNSGLDAQVTITNSLGEVVSTSNLNSNDGWSRKIISFNPGNSSQIRIDLGAATTVSDNSVYFDDINIEPVLEVGTDTQGAKQYVARECRLYPTSDSLTCVNKNNNVLKDGLEGYCLEHDENNKNVCLTWYPIDNISSTQLAHTSSGYQGKFPLNYCTEVNGNFDLVEKRKPWLIKSDSPLSHCESADNVPTSYYHLDQSGMFSVCGKDYVGFSYSYSYDDANLSGHEHCSIDYWCVPIGAGKVTVEMSQGGGAFSSDNAYLKHGTDFPPSSFVDYTNQKMIFPTGENYSEGALRLDDDNKELQIRISVTDGGGWYRYNGLDTTNNKETEFADPAVRVYDYNYPPSDESNLKLISGTDTDKIYRLTCNNFINVVDSNGDNMAWASRIGINSAWPTSTPPFFVDYANSGLTYFNNASVHGLTAYGRNRETVPFGAATWPDSLSLLNSEAIPLRNQFSLKNNENIFAGRPYGCSNYNSESGVGCANIGYCSSNPDVYCLTASSDTYVSKKTCAEGGFGTCVPMWNNYLGTTNNNNSFKDYQNILKTLFLNSYSSYTFSGGSYTSANMSLPNTSTPCPNNIRPEATFSNPSVAESSFCFVPPLIGSAISVTYNNQKISSSKTFNVDKKGIYGVQFTSQIDPEQQPLKEIKIEWGDGYTQIITGQDSHPSMNNPHVFYHYYKQTGTQTIKITIKDNWDKATNN